MIFSIHLFETVSDKAPEPGIFSVLVNPNLRWMVLQKQTHNLKIHSKEKNHLVTQHISVSQFLLRFQDHFRERIGPVAYAGFIPGRLEGGDPLEKRGPNRSVTGW